MRVIVIGFKGTDEDVDCEVVDRVAEVLLSRGLDHLIPELLEGCASGFNMTSNPERGDAIDAIVPGVELVVALNLYGTSKLPGGPAPPSVGDLYDEKNWLLLNECTSVGAKLICFKEQLAVQGDGALFRRERIMVVRGERGTGVEILSIGVCGSRSVRNGRVNGAHNSVHIRRYLCYNINSGADHHYPTGRGIPRH